MIPTYRFQTYITPNYYFFFNYKIFSFGGQARSFANSHIFPPESSDGSRLTCREFQRAAVVCCPAKCHPSRSQLRPVTVCRSGIISHQTQTDTNRHEQTRNWCGRAVETLWTEWLILDRKVADLWHASHLSHVIVL